MRRRVGHALAITLVPTLALALACGPGLDPPSVVERTRVVAARVSPERDGAIAWPSPGDAIVIEWIVVSPGAPELLAATLVACAPLPGPTGTPGCSADTIVPLPARAPSTEPFVTELAVPGPEALRGASSLLISGAICIGGGTPSISGGTEAPTCEGGPEGARAELIVLTIPLATSDEVAPNRHPSIADEAWTLEGAAWDERPSDLPEACADVAGTAALPRVSLEPARDLPITIGASDDDREEYQTIAGDPPMPVARREALQINHYATAGSMQRGVSAVDDATTIDPPIDVDWTPPPAEEVPASGLLVRFTVVARDGRSGVDRAERALCVVP